MVAGLGVMDTVLCILAARMKKPWLIAIFVISFICSLGMGYLSSKDFAEASMNWIAEGVNVVGQGTLLLGVYLLHKNGLADIEAQKEA
jgi:DNA-binding transcriptional regulator of glucitol operon